MYAFLNLAISVREFYKALPEGFDIFGKGDAVDEGGKHTHIVAGSKFNAAALDGSAAHNIAAAHDDGELNTSGGDGFSELFGEPVDKFGIDSEFFTAGKLFAGKL